MQGSLFDTEAPAREALGEQALLLRGYALSAAPMLLQAIAAIERLAPTRQMQTPGGFTMSVATTNCGDWGWTSDRRGYRYRQDDPLSGQPWPALPAAMRALAHDAAAQAGFAGFAPDACLINRYSPGARLSLHQDKNERDFSAPIVSVSLGIDAVFLFGGMTREARPRRVLLRHGDVAVWGGIDRLRYHGVAPLVQACHPLLGAQRINLTFRKAD